MKVWVVDPYNISKSDWVLEWPAGEYDCGDYDVWHRKYDHRKWREADFRAILLGHSSDDCMAHVNDYFARFEFRLVSPGGIHVYDLRPSDRRLASR